MSCSISIKRMISIVLVVFFMLVFIPVENKAYAEGENISGLRWSDEYEGDGNYAFDPAGTVLTAPAALNDDSETYPITYTWNINGEDIESQSVTVYDIGGYYCNITDGSGMSLGYYANVTADSGLRWSDEYEGDGNYAFDPAGTVLTAPAALNDDSETYPITYTWNINGEDIESQSVTVYDIGGYYCNITDGSGMSLGYYANVTADSGLRWSDEYEGDGNYAFDPAGTVLTAPAALNDDSETYPITYTWNINGEDIESQSVTVYDIGAYYCNITDGSGMSLGYYANVTADSGLRWSDEYEGDGNYAFDPAGTVLTAPAALNDDSETYPITYTWNINGEDIESQSVTVYDIGGYYCNITDGSGMSLGYYANVTADSGLRWSDEYEGDGNYAFDPAGTVLTAPAALNDDSETYPITYTWNINGEDIESQSVTVYDIGAYYCNITDGSGMSLGYYANVTADSGLRWSDEYEGDGNYAFDPAGTVLTAPAALNDDSETYPITYTWNINGEDIESQSVTVYDIGGYYCNITDGSGMSLGYYANVTADSGLRWSDEYEGDGNYAFDPAGTVLTAPAALNDDSETYPITYTWNINGEDIESQSVTVYDIGGYYCNITDGSGMSLVYYANVTADSGLRWSDEYESDYRDSDPVYIELGGSIELVAPTAINNDSETYQITYTWNINGETEESQIVTVYEAGECSCIITDGSGNWLEYRIRVNYDSGLVWSDGYEYSYRHGYDIPFKPGESIKVKAPSANNNDGTAFPIEYTWRDRDYLHVSYTDVLTVNKPGNYYCTIEDGSGNSLLYDCYVKYDSGLRWSDNSEKIYKYDTFYIQPGESKVLKAPLAVNDYSGMHPIIYSWSFDGEDVESQSITAEEIGFYSCRIEDGSGNYLYYVVNVNYDSGLQWADGYEESVRVADTVYIEPGETFISFEAPAAVNKDNTMYPISYDWYYSEDVNACSQKIEVSNPEPGWYDCTITDESGNSLVYRVLVTYDTDLQLTLDDYSVTLNSIHIMGHATVNKIDAEPYDAYIDGLYVYPYCYFYDGGRDQAGEFLDDGGYCYNDRGIGFCSITETEDQYRADFEVTIDISDGYLAGDTLGICVDNMYRESKTYEFQVPDHKTGWQSIDGKTYYISENGEYASGWCKIDSEWYFFNTSTNALLTNGWAKDSKDWMYMDTSGKITKDKWIKSGGEWYYLKANGYMASNEWAKDSKGWMYMDASGKITKDKWIKSGGEWYYLKANGYMASNEWAKDSKGWMYMDASGKITKDKWIKSGGEWYYLKANGYMASNEWAKDSKGWMYMDASGKITKDKWIKSGGEWYYLKANGYMASNEWAKDSKGWMYMDASGKITKDKWIKSGGEWYYLKSNGYMAANEYAKDSSHTYWMDANGKIANTY